MTMKEFFSRTEIATDIQQLILKLNSQKFESEQKKASLLTGVLKIIGGNSRLFDESCQTNIEWIGESLANLINQAVFDELNVKVLDDLYTSLFRFITEFDLCMQGDMSFELRRFIDYADDEAEAFSGRSLQQIQFARQQMPIAILKKLVGSPILKNVAETQKIADLIQEKFTAWNKELNEKERTATQLKEALETYTTAFNFVGLHEGFDRLSKAKTLEVKGLNRLLVGFGVLAGVPLFAELVGAAFYLDRFKEWNANMLFAAIPAFSLTVLLIYFFRIVLRRTEAARSQLLQIELRKTLCQFIQSYASYAKEIKGDNPEALSKFENIIFSGLVSTDDKLPTTFDGVDQLGQLIQAIRGGK